MLIRPHCSCGLLLFSILPIVGCLEPSKGGCEVDADCPARGHVCNVMEAVCEEAEFDASSTEDPAPMTFANKAVPFFRGTVCTVMDVRSGSPIPVRLNPCFHDCMTIGQHKFQHYYECRGSSCDAWALLWVNASSGAMGCPADAFGEFDQARCNWDVSVDIKINTTTGDSQPIRGSMVLEIPFLTNADLAAIVPDPTAAEVTEKIEQYPRDDSRIVGGRSISLSDAHPIPPDVCDANACECFTVGF